MSESMGISDYVGAVKVSGDEAKQFWNRILTEGIQAHADQIAPILGAGEIACVVFEPTKAVAEAAAEMGWDGNTSVFRMTDGVRKRMARRIARDYPEDRVTPRWLTSKTKGRIFFLVTEASLLVNFDPDVGYSIEPGSMDEEWMN